MRCVRNSPRHMSVCRSCTRRRWVRKAYAVIERSLVRRALGGGTPSSGCGAARTGGCGGATAMDAAVGADGGVGRCRHHRRMLRRSGSCGSRSARGRVSTPRFWSGRTSSGSTWAAVVVARWTTLPMRSSTSMCWRSGWRGHGQPHPPDGRAGPLGHGPMDRLCRSPPRAGCRSPPCRRSPDRRSRAAQAHRGLDVPTHRPQSSSRHRGSRARRHRTLPHRPPRHPGHPHLGTAGRGMTTAAGSRGDLPCRCGRARAGVAAPC